MTALRAYQQETVARIGAEISAGKRRVLLVVPTGGGKTVIAGEVIARARQQKQRILVLAHRREIIGQTSAKLHAVGVDHGIIQAGFPPRTGEAVQVASISTLHARAVRLNKIELPPADLVVVDEAHHCRARSWRRIMAAYPGAVIIGMTATPCRGDGRGLGSVFDCIVEGPQVAELIAGGFLVPTRVYAPVRPDLRGVQIRHGDYDEQALAQRMNDAKLRGDVVAHFHKLANRQPTIVFASGVAHSVHLRDEFRASGVLAEHIDGSTPISERDKILKGLADGTVEVVCNAMVLTEGVDLPAVSCLVLARPTKHMGLYRQMVGRALRPSPGKVFALILDHAGAVFEHGLPDEPVQWTLSEDQRAVNPVQTARALRQAPGLADCPECKAVRMQGSQCPVCGWRPQPKARSVVVAHGELGEVGRNRTAKSAAYSDADKRLWHGALLYIANERAMKRPFNMRGWVYHKYSEKFGQPPPLDAPPGLPPSAEIRAWVRSRDIAYARSMDRRRGAA